MSIIRRSLLPARRGLTRRTAVSSLGAVFIGLMFGAKPLLAAALVRVTFSGFQRNSGGDCMVFVHLDRRTETIQSQQGTLFTVRFRDAAISVRNNQHVLDLSHFGLLIQSSQLVPLDNDVELRIELRKRAELVTSWVERENGQASLHVHIPASSNG